MIDGNAGKGDRYRPVDRKKWEEWWDRWAADAAKREKDELEQKPRRKA